MPKNLFIVLDGLDGSGKSLMVKKLHDYLSSKDMSINILSTREPSDSEYGKRLREILANDPSPNTRASEMLELFVKDREQHIKDVIIPFMDKETDALNVVISDRYYYSTIAFQSTQGLDIVELVERNKGFLRPDITFILDLDPKVALSRISGRRKEKFEQLEFMENLRKIFNTLPNILKDNIKIINSDRPQKEVFEEIKQGVEEILPSKN
jgi:dTMP kinase